MSIIEEIAAERARQIAVEGWTPEHDDQHSGGELARAAACYAAGDHQNGLWPWHEDWWKPSTRRRDLIKAAALLVAEIERRDRGPQEPPMTTPDATQGPDAHRKSFWVLERDGRYLSLRHEPSPHGGTYIVPGWTDSIVEARHWPSYQYADMERRGLGHPFWMSTPVEHAFIGAYSDGDLPEPSIPTPPDLSLLRPGGEVDVRVRVRLVNDDGSFVAQEAIYNSLMYFEAPTYSPRSITAIHAPARVAEPERPIAVGDGVRDPRGRFGRSGGAGWTAQCTAVLYEDNTWMDWSTDHLTRVAPAGGGA